MRTGLPGAQFYYLAVPNIFTIDREPDQCAYFMPALFACSSRVHIETLYGRIEHDTEYMGVARYEEGWLLSV